MKQTYCERLFRACASGLLREEEKGALHPVLNPAPIQLAFAAQRPFISADTSRRLPLPGEKLRPDEQEGADEITGDAVTLHRLAQHLALYDLRVEARPPSTLTIEFAQQGHSIVFIGSPYRNAFLKQLEEQDRCGYGAYFDPDAPAQEGCGRIIFKYRPALERDTHCQESHPGDGPPSRFTVPINPTEADYAVVRRWRTIYGNDAILIAGTSAQGTAGAVEFMCTPTCVEDLFRKLQQGETGARATSWEQAQFDAVLQVPFLSGEAATIIIAERR